MKLNAQQLAAFDELGYVFLPNCFSEEEIGLMRAEGEAILKSDRQEVWREKTGAPRTAFAAHTFSEVFRCWRAIRAWSNRCSNTLAKTSTSTSSSSTPRPRSKATSGSGIRTMAPGRATTGCRNRAP
jgi:hypothetical protein